jgi:hypothetical protein
MPTSAIASTRCSRPTKRYGVIYADPPWNFKNCSKKGTGRNAVAHFQCMDFPANRGAPTPALGGKGLRAAPLATDPSQPKALELIELWGFKYKTVGFHWAKTNKRANLDSYLPTTSLPASNIGRAPTSSSACWLRGDHRQLTATTINPVYRCAW